MDLKTNNRNIQKKNREKIKTEKKNEQSFSELCDNFRQPNRFVIGVLEREELRWRGGEGVENISEIIMDGKTLYLMETINLQIPET